MPMFATTNSFAQNNTTADSPSKNTKIEEEKIAAANATGANAKVIKKLKPVICVNQKNISDGMPVKAPS